MTARAEAEAGSWTGPGRTRAVWRALAEALPAPGTVLDCGGGSGSYAVPLASAGAQVTVIDVSADALATLARRATEAGVGARIAGVQGEVEHVPALTRGAAFDLVLAHGILEAVDDPRGAFAGIAAAVRPGGWLSVLVPNPAAVVLGRAIAGDVEAALAVLQDASEQLPEAVPKLADEAGLRLHSRHGVAVFSDYIPGAVLDRPGLRDALAGLEDAAGDREPYIDIAARLHLLMHRPG